MGRDKKDATSDVFIINREVISDPNIIVNHINDFFLNIGCTGDDDEHGYKNYLIGEHLYDEFQFNLINNQHTSSIIFRIKTKYSYGYDEISSALLKIIINEITPSLTLIINQCLNYRYISRQTKDR